MEVLKAGNIDFYDLGRTVQEKPISIREIKAFRSLGWTN